MSDYFDIHLSFKLLACEYIYREIGCINIYDEFSSIVYNYITILKQQCREIKNTPMVNKCVP